MKSRRITKPLDLRFGLGLIVFLSLLGGCASPPSLTPLLQAVDRALDDEHQQVTQDAERQSAWLQQQQQALRAAFEADLNEQQSLQRDWVAEHVRVYVTARETLTEHHHRLRQTYRMRLENLQAASLAQQRAIALIQRQDQLFERLPDLRRWLQQQQTQQENPRD